MSPPAVDVDAERREKRKSERLEVRLPCTVEWGSHRVQGRISNLSEGGAWITRLRSAPPPEGAIVTLKFQIGTLPISVVSSVTSRVLRSMVEIVADGDIGSLAICFEDQSSEARQELRSVLASLRGS